MAEVIPIQQDFADEERRERLEYQQENNNVYKFLGWTFAIIVSAAFWGLALTALTWSKSLYQWLTDPHTPWYVLALFATIAGTIVTGLLYVWQVAQERYK